MPPDVIDSFSGEYRFLSNFWMKPIIFPNIQFPSVENAYQAAKTEDVSLWEEFSLCSPAEAKKLGRTLPIRDNWEQVKLGYMYQLLQMKFAHHSELAKRLLATGDAFLIEGNHWGDTYWGVCNGEGYNHLGQLLMMVRANLQTSVALH